MKKRYEPMASGVICGVVKCDDSQDNGYAIMLNVNGEISALLSVEQAALLADQLAFSLGLLSVVKGSQLPKKVLH